MENRMTDENDLKEISRELLALDVDPEAAARIASAARRGRPILRVIEVVAVALLAAGILVWAAIKVLEALR
jgi:hypothetical protein